MKKKYLLFILFYSFLSIAQNGAPAAPYYDGFNWNLTGIPLRDALADKITNTHTRLLTYTPGIWEATKITDLDPNNPDYVLLVYGWEDGSDSDNTNDLYRGKDAICSGTNQCSLLWNREHVYAKSLGTPTFDDDARPTSGVSDAGEDAHHIRAADVARNNDRLSEKFTDGSGNSRDITSTTWYPGDIWKGDVARMMMYMYLRYGTQCKPINVGVGNPISIDPDMIDLFLKWNAEDPVDQYEDNRNTYHDSNGTYAQGNRNPFIDNPYLAKVIWGGTPAQNRWPGVFLSTDEFNTLAKVMIYPNPSNENRISIQSEIQLDSIEIINVNGQLIQKINNPDKINNQYSVENLSSGFYFVKLNTNSLSTTKKIIIN